MDGAVPSSLRKSCARHQVCMWEIVVIHGTENKINRVSTMCGKLELHVINE